MFILIVNDYRHYDEDEVYPMLLDVYDNEKNAYEVCDELNRNNPDEEKMVYEVREADHIGVDNFDNIWYSNYESLDEYILKLPNYKNDDYIEMV